MRAYSGILILDSHIRQRTKSTYNLLRKMFSTADMFIDDGYVFMFRKLFLIVCEQKEWSIETG